MRDQDALNMATVFVNSSLIGCEALYLDVSVACRDTVRTQFLIE